MNLPQVFAACKLAGLPVRVARRKPRCHPKTHSVAVILAPGGHLREDRGQFLVEFRRDDGFLHRPGKSHWTTAPVLIPWPEGLTHQQWLDPEYKRGTAVDLGEALYLIKAVERPEQPPASLRPFCRPRGHRDVA